MFCVRLTDCYNRWLQNISSAEKTRVQTKLSREGLLCWIHNNEEYLNMIISSKALHVLTYPYLQCNLKGLYDIKLYDQ